MRAYVMFGLCTITIAACSDDGQPKDSRVPDARTMDATMDGSVLDSRSAPDSYPVDRAAPDAATSAFFSGELANAAGAVADVEICLFKQGKKTTDCTKTNAAGHYSIQVPLNAEVGVLFEKSGYEKKFFPLYLTGPVAIGKTGMWTDATASSEYAKVGVIYPPVGKGHIVVNGSAISIAVVPKSGVGPYYGGSGFDVKLTEAPAAADGWGEIMDLPAGTYDVDVTHVTKACKGFLAWPPSAGHTLRVPVLDGFFSGVFTQCQ